MLRTLVVAALCGVAMPIAPAFAYQPLVIGGQSDRVLHVGTPIHVRTMTELTTQNKVLRVGQRFEIETVEAVNLDGQLVIPVGTTGVGEITSVRNKGMWGKSGHFDIELRYLRMGDRQIKIMGKADDKGVAGGAGAVAVSALIFLPAGFFMTGTSARLPAGTNILATLSEDVPVAFAPSVATPLVVATTPSLPAMTATPTVAMTKVVAASPAAGPALTPAVVEIKSVSAPKK